MHAWVGTEIGLRMRVMCCVRVRTWVSDELRDGRHGLVHPDGAQHEHELELGVALRPLRQLVEDEYGHLLWRRARPMSRFCFEWSM